MQTGFAPPMQHQKNNCNCTQDFALDGPAGRQGLTGSICLGCCFHSFVTVVFKAGRDLGYFHLKLKVVIPILTYLAFFFCKARKLKSNNSCREDSAGALTQVCALPAARPFVEGISVCKPNSDSVNTCHKRQ